MSETPIDIMQPSSIKIGDPRTVNIDPTRENIIFPVCDVMVITVNGEIWRATLPAFGLTENMIEELYQEKRDELFKKG